MQVCLLFLDFDAICSLNILVPLRSSPPSLWSSRWEGREGKRGRVASKERKKNGLKTVQGLNDTEGGKIREMEEKGRTRGGRSPQSDHVVFEAGSWRDNRGGFIPQTQ